MSVQTASNAIDWPLLDDEPPAYTAQASSSEVVAADQSLPSNSELTRTLRDCVADMVADQDASNCFPEHIAQWPIIQPNFHADDYVEDDNHIPAVLLTNDIHDNWLPDPPSHSPKIRPVDFRSSHPKGSAVITFEDSDGTLGKVDNLDVDIIAVKSPLIAAAFESSEHGQQCLHLDALTSISAKPFARYLYIGSYAEVNDEFEQVPSSLLLHCHLHYLGALFDITELKLQALMNVIRQCEFACFSNEQPIDLCAALRFCYNHHAYCQKPIEDIIAYCITRFSAHKLAKDDAFRLLAYEHQHFRSDLARVLVERNFADEAAIDLIRLPFALTDETSQSSIDALINPRNKTAVGRKHVGNEKQVSRQEKDAAPLPMLAGSSRTPVQASNQQSLLTLALRNKHAASGELELENGMSDAVASHKRRKSEDQGFVLISPVAKPTTELPLRILRESSGESDDFVLLSRAASPTSTEHQQSAQHMHSNDCTSPTVGEASDAPVNAEIEPCSPRSDSSWVLT